MSQPGASARSNKGSSRRGPQPAKTLNRSVQGSNLPNPECVKRPNFGTGGRRIRVLVNSFATTIPQLPIHHYDVVIMPSERTLPVRFTMELISILQSTVAPEIFTPPAAYDGQKNLFSPRELSLGRSGSGEFEVPVPRPGQSPKIFQIRLTKVAEINPEVLQRFINGEQSNDSTVLTAISALNVVIRMEPTQHYPFNVRSFFTDREKKHLGVGLEVWRGYFQSVRPGIGRLLINIDISTGLMYKAGSLIDLILEFTKQQSIQRLGNIPTRERLRLQKFLSGLRIEVKSALNPGTSVMRTIKKLSQAAAHTLTFTSRDGRVSTVSEYFRRQNCPLKYPNLPCVEVASSALIPLEVCKVPPGQLIRQQVPPELTSAVLEFATMKPPDRLRSIVQGLNILEYGQSQYVRSFGMHVDTATLQVNARILPPPVLKYNQQQTVTPQNGKWTMEARQFHKPARIRNWALIVFDARFSRDRDRNVPTLVKALTQACIKSGIDFDPDGAVGNSPATPLLAFENGQGDVGQRLKAIGDELYAQTRKPPHLFVIILPDGANDLYTAIKHFGDCTIGIATQCLKGNKCTRAKDAYWINVALKINVKLGGINVVPASSPVLTDPSNATIVMGADVIHPAPGSGNRPSFTAVVGSVDSSAAKYVATCKVQPSRQEMIADLKEMTKHILTSFRDYRRAIEKVTSPPTRLIFYRDGVSEGQFKQVLDLELPAIRAACQELRINPKITLLIVGKRHHIRLFPAEPRDGDPRSGNCPPGTVVDTDISHPTEFDFYLQSHAGLLGTSRSAHYSVLHDENKFNADTIQSLSYALCHVYARSTSAVSIPAPVYYADIVASRAKNHYTPQGNIDFDTSSDGDGPSLEVFRNNFVPLHGDQEKRMYFA